MDLREIQEWFTARNIVTVPARRGTDGKHHPAVWGWSSLTEPHPLPRYMPPGTGLSGLTGQKSGVWVVDIDPRNGGDATWRALCGARSVPSTLTTYTAGGGTHYWFRLPPGAYLRKSTHGLGPGVDVLGENAAPTIAGTRPDGRSYMHDFREPVYAPVWLWDRVSHLLGPVRDSRPADRPLELPEVDCCPVFAELRFRLLEACSAGDRPEVLKLLGAASTLTSEGHVGLLRTITDATPVYIRGRKALEVVDGKKRTGIGGDWTRMLDCITAAIPDTLPVDPCTVTSSWALAGKYKGGHHDHAGNGSAAAA